MGQPQWQAGLCGAAPLSRIHPFGSELNPLIDTSRKQEPLAAPGPSRTISPHTLARTRHADALDALFHNAPHKSADCPRKPPKVVTGWRRQNGSRRLARRLSLSSTADLNERYCCDVRSIGC